MPERREARFAPAREMFELPVAEGGSIRVEGLMIPDKRRTQELRVVLPDGRALLVEGVRRAWFVRMEGDEASCAGGELTGCIASVLGWWDDTWPDEKPPA